MYKIQTLNNIAEKGLGLLSKESYEIADQINEPDAILVRSYKMHDMELTPSIKAIARAGAGVNNIPVDVCSEKGIVVFNTPGANANGVKELVIAGLLLSSRKIIQGIEWAKGLSGNGNDVPKLIEKGKSNFVGPEILGKKLGVIGLGAIGVMVANAAQSLGMEVTGYDPFISVEAAWGLSRAVTRATTLEQLMAEADYITIHVPLLSETKNMIDAEKIDLMKDGARILNFSRDGLVNNEDLKVALTSGKVGCYVTDFPNEGLLDADNVIAIPHLGASTPESEENCAIMAADELRDYLENGNIKNSVNYPNCTLARTNAPYRLAVNHQNIPNMVGQITTVLANQNINIADMLNRSKGNFAYTLLDIEENPSEDTLKKIENIHGITRVRVIK